MIYFNRVSKSFGTQEVLADVSFTVNPGEHIGIVGPNGAGKTTLFEMLAGHMSPDGGNVVCPNDLAIGYVRQQLNPHLEQATLLDYTANAVAAVRELQDYIHALEASLPGLPDEERQRALKRLGELQTRFEHLGGYDLRTRAESALSALGFPVAEFVRPFARFSGGWQMRAELARTLISEPDLLLLDEPTNYLDVPAVEWLRDSLRDFRGTLLLISHDRYLLNSLTSVTVEVAAAQATRYPGNYAYYVREREGRVEQLLAAKKNQDRRREQLERFIERFKAKNTKSSQAQSRMKMLEKLEEIDIPGIVAKPPPIRLPTPPHCGTEVARIEDGGVTYDGQRWVLRHVNLSIEKGEKLAVVGLNGMGKTTLLRVLAGRLRVNEGALRLGHKVAVGYQSQDFTEIMSPDMTVYDTARKAAADRSDGQVRALLGGFGFSGDAIDKKVAVLSGGEKVRLALARILLTPCNFLILDEPTTHLDIHAREALEEALREYAGTLCLVTHDIEFVRHAAAGILAMTPEGVKRYHGDYDYYREKLARDQAGQVDSDAEGLATPTKAQERKEQKRRQAAQRQELYRRRKPLDDRVSTAEKRIAALEKEQEDLSAALSNDSQAKDYADLNRRLSMNQAEIAHLTREWEEAALALEALLEEEGS